MIFRPPRFPIVHDVVMETSGFVRPIIILVGFVIFTFT